MPVCSYGCICQWHRYKEDYVKVDTLRYVRINTYIYQIYNWWCNIRKRQRKIGYKCHQNNGIIVVEIRKICKTATQYSLEIYESTISDVLT